jgi:DNA ligase 1
MTGFADLADGESTQVKGSGSSVYTLKNSGGVMSCTCPAWRNQSIGIETRTCKHLRAFRGDEAETARVGEAALSGRPPKPAKPIRVLAEGEVATPYDDEGPPLLLAHKWENDVDLTGWWLSEKLDGVRAYWDGTQFISRLGNRFFAPRWFTEKLPPTPLDGELWGGRKLFQRTVGIVKRQDESELWRELKFMVFDAPQHGGVFEERVAFVEQTVADLAIDWLEALPHERCTSTAHLLEQLQRVEALGGEGLMVRQPGSRYEAGRSSTLYKVKTFHDAEARVVEHVPGMGKHKGRMGALMVELENGIQFNVGTGFSDAERSEPPGIGALITFRYQELSNTGVPRFPSYVGVRIDGRFRPKNSAAQSATVQNASAPAQPPKSPAPMSAPKTTEVSSVTTPSTLATKGTRMSMRRFEMTDGDERFFWEIETVGLKQKIRFGTFDEKSKVFEDNAEATENSLQKIKEKMAKGFVEVSAPTAAAVSVSSAPAAKPAAASPAPSPAPAPAAAPTPAPTASDTVPVSAVQRAAGARYFEFVEGGSAKFWEIRVEGTSFFTRYGKLGTAGQITQKDFDTEAKTQVEADKLVAEKTKKGYAEK